MTRNAFKMTRRVFVVESYSSEKLKKTGKTRGVDGWEIRNHTKCEDEEIFEM